MSSFVMYYFLESKGCVEMDWQRLVLAHVFENSNNNFVEMVVADEVDVSINPICLTCSSSHEWLLTIQFGQHVNDHDFFNLIFQMWLLTYLKPHLSNNIHQSLFDSPIYGFISFGFNSILVEAKENKFEEIVQVIRF